ncbi:MAG: CoA-binding protein [Candidatus Woesearchaeota archaeon]
MRVAVVGASMNRGKFGNKAVRAYVSKGNDVFPVNPNEKEVEGLRCFASVLQIPDGLDLVLMYVPPAIGEKIVDDIIRKNPGAVYLNPGTESDVIMSKLKAAGIKFYLACAIHALGITSEDMH